MSYRDLNVYKLSFKLACEIHQYSLALPKHLQFDLGDQIRRASRSIPSNIAEGVGRNKSEKDKVNFIYDALGSNDEMLFNLDFLLAVNLLSEDQYQRWVSNYTICGKQLYSLAQSIKPVTSNK